VWKTNKLLGAADKRDKKGWFGVIGGIKKDVNGILEFIERATGPDKERCGGFLNILEIGS
jgi:hypothetical protein